MSSCFLHSDGICCDGAAPLRALELMRSDSLDGLAPAESPRDCVIAYRIGPDKVMLVSYDRGGADYEQFTTTSEGATDMVRARLLERVRLHDGRAGPAGHALRIVKDDA